MNAESVAMSVNVQSGVLDVDLHLAGCFCGFRGFACTLAGWLW